MNCIVIYYESDAKKASTKGFTDVEKAAAWIEANKHISDARILIDYAAVQVYKEMYEDMKKEFFTSMKEFKRREI
jgi:hypothetical protein